MEEPVVVRGAVAADAPAIAQLDARSWPRGTYVVPPRPEWTRDPAETTLACVGGRIVGYVLLGRSTELDSNAHVLQVQGIAVDPDLRGRGIGETLLRWVIAEGRRRGARKLSLRALSTNPTALRLYERVGFVVEGRLAEEFFLHDRYVDDLLLGLRLD